MSDHFEAWVTVIPARDRVKETARELLALAGDPRDVRTLGNGDEFLVPPELAAVFNRTEPETKPRAPRKPRVKKEAD